MATQQLPDGWVMGNGTWNVDASLSVGTGRNGATSLKFGGTAALTTMFGPWVPLDNTSISSAYEITYQATNITTAIFLIKFVVYDITCSTVLTNVILLNGTPPNVNPISNTLTSPAGPWGRYEVYKSNATVDFLNLTLTDVRPLPCFWTSTFTTTKVIASSASWQTVQMLPASSVLSGVVDFGTGISVQLIRAGIYQLSFAAYFQAVPAAKQIACRITSTGFAFVIAQGLITTGLLGDHVVCCSGLVQVLQASTGSGTNDLLTAQVLQNTGGNLNLLGTTAVGSNGGSQFTGVSVR